MFKTKLFLDLMIDPTGAFFHYKPAFDGDGAANGGGGSAGDGQGGGEGQAAGDQGKNGQAGAGDGDGGQGKGAKKDHPTHDEQGRSYYELHQETVEKYKGVDLDRWARVNEIDPEEYQELKGLADDLMKDPALYDDVKQLLADFKAGTYKPKGAANRDPLVQQLAKKLDGVLKERDTERAERQKETERKLVESFDKEVDGTINSVLKSVKIEKLLPRELEFVKAEIDTAFIKDAESKKPVLTTKDLPKLVEEAVKKVEKERREILALSVKKDGGAPTNANGGSGGDFTKAAPVRDRRQRITQIAGELKGMFNK